MANQNAPYGFRLSSSMTTPIAIGNLTGYVDSSNATAIFKGDPVMGESDGNLAPATAGAAYLLAGIADEIYTLDSFGNKVPVSYLPALTAGYVSYIPVFPGQVWEVQATTAAITDVFATADFASGSGNTSTGQSKYVLTGSDLGTGTQMRLIGLVPVPNNAWGSYARVQVVFVESMFQQVTTI